MLYSSLTVLLQAEQKRHLSHRELILNTCQDETAIEMNPSYRKASDTLLIPHHSIFGMIFAIAKITLQPQRILLPRFCHC